MAMLVLKSYPSRKEIFSSWQMRGGVGVTNFREFWGEGCTHKELRYPNKKLGIALYPVCGHISNYVNACIT